MILGWKTELAKKAVETIILNLAMLTVKEIFTEGVKFIREKLKDEESEEPEESKECSEPGGHSKDDEGEPTDGESNDESESD